MITVSKDGSGDFRSVQEAVLSVDDHRSEPVTIYLKPGIYEEKVFIRKENIRLVGTDREITIIRYSDGAKKLRPDGNEYGTFNTATVLFAGSNITVENITFESSAGPGKIAGQALAVFIASDRTSFYRCAFLGHQDTIFTGNFSNKSFMNLMLPDFFTKSSVTADFKTVRNYFEDCYICGDVDYIFGPNIAYFNHCEICSKLRGEEGGCYITAASTPKEQEYGYVFHQCRLTSTGEKSGLLYLGRPWRDYAKTAFIECSMDAPVTPAGWLNWGKASAEVNSTYIEYGNTGAGADTSQRVSFCKTLDNPDIPSYFSASNVLKGEDDWNPILK